MKKFAPYAPYAALAVVLIVVWLFMRPSSHDKNAPTQSMPTGQAVSVVTLHKQNIQLSYELPGRITPYRQAQLRPQVDGIITQRLFEEGAEVEKGQQLYQIEDARYAAALKSAEADLQSAQANIKTVTAKEKRYKDLVKIKAVSAQEYDDVKAEYDQAVAAIAVAQAAVDLAQVNLDYTKVYAPISGRISRSYVTEGALVTSNQTDNLATITQLDPVYVDMQQSGVEVVKLRTGMSEANEIPVSLILDEKTGQMYSHKGSLKFSEVTVEETTGSITLRALMPNEDGLLLPGLFVRAKLDLGEQEVLLVPQRAGTRLPDGGLIFWVVDGANTAQKRVVSTTQSYKNYWVVASGLEAGDRVIVEGTQKIGENAPVSPSIWAGASNAAPQASSH